MGESPLKRSIWTKGIDPPIPIMRETRKPVDILWYVGDFASYHPQGQQAARALVKIFRALGVNFGILGPDLPPENWSKANVSIWSNRRQKQWQNGRYFQQNRSS
jgi:hypothetical protein